MNFPFYSGLKSFTLIFAGICGNVFGQAQISSMMDAGTIKVNNGELVVSNLDLVSPGLNELTFEPGPLSETQSFRISDSNQFLISHLSKPIGNKGSLIFWFKTDREYSGAKAKLKYSQKLAEVKGLFTLSFAQEENCVSLDWQWVGNANKPGNMLILLPAIGEPKWVHLAFAWDTLNGYFNCYINGTPYRTPGMKVDGWNVGSGKTLAICPGRFAFSEVSISDTPFEDSVLKRLVGKKHIGALDKFLGVISLGSIDSQDFKGKLWYHNRLASKQDIFKWVIEGPVDINFADGWMIMKSRSENKNVLSGHIVHWCDQIFSGDFVAEFEVQILSEYGLNIIFFAAHGINGEYAFDPALSIRDGLFKQYINGDLNSYHISYYASTPDEARSTANLRKNSGFYLISNGPVAIPHNDKNPHVITLIKQGGHIRLAVDGKLVINYIDDGKKYGPVWGKGCIGLRQMKWSVCRYRNFSVYELSKLSGS